MRLRVLAMAGRRSAAEAILLAGPRRLAQYERVPYAWMRALTPRNLELDWNTLMTLPRRIPRLSERLAAVADCYEYMLPDEPAPDVVDPDKEMRDAIAQLRHFATGVFSPLMHRFCAADSPRIDPVAVNALPHTVVRRDCAVDEFAVQEWAAWLDRMEEFVKDSVRVVKRTLTGTPRKRPSDGDDSEPKRVAVVADAAPAIT